MKLIVFVQKFPISRIYRFYEIIFRITRYLGNQNFRLRFERIIKSGINPSKINQSSYKTNQCGRNGKHQKFCYSILRILITFMDYRSEILQCKLLLVYLQFTLSRSLKCEKRNFARNIAREGEKKRGARGEGRG